MQIIIHNFYKENTLADIKFYILEYKKKILIKYNELIKDNFNAIIKIDNHQYAKYRIHLSNFKNITYEVLINNKSLLICKTSILYFDFKSALNIIKLTKKEFNENEVIIKKNRHESAMKFWHLFWNSLHYLSYSYPDNPNNEDKKQIVDLINTMRKDGINCSYCRIHFNRWCTKYKIEDYYNNKDDLIKFFIDLHNNVNNRNNKKILSIDDVNAIYLNFDSEYLKKYGLDINKLWENKIIYKLPEIINGYTRHILLDEFQIIKFA